MLQKIENRQHWCEQNLHFPFQSSSDYSIETSQMPYEAKSSFIYGNFISTVLVAVAFCEHTISDWLYLMALKKPKQRIGLEKLMKKAKNAKLFSEDFWENFDDLRKIRNAYTHRCWDVIPCNEVEDEKLSSAVRPDSYTVTARTRPPQKNQLTPEERDRNYPSPSQLMEQDAKDALLLMDIVYRFRHSSGIIKEDF
ncbi:MAG: hypothetical protein RR800_01750 [Comamonas sp.]